MRDEFVDQVRLLVKCLPHVGEEKSFALKGGTAINLFHRNLPRLSVDIDLAYLPIQDRESSLKEIDAAFERVAERLRKGIGGVSVQRISGGGNGDTRILVSDRNSMVKIETSPVTRGVVHPITSARVVREVESRFGFAEVPVVSFLDLYAGKLVAALDRQHPRDLFDVMSLYEHGGIGRELFSTFLVYVASSSRPMDELINPRLRDLEAPFSNQFEGMTSQGITCGELERVRSRMIADLKGLLDDRSRQFLLDLHDCVPDFGSIGLPAAAELPAIRWKLTNLGKLKSDNPGKHAEQRRVLLTALG